MFPTCRQHSESVAPWQPLRHDRSGIAFGLLLGFLLLGLAIYFLSPLLPAGLRAPALAALIAGAGIYLGFVDNSGHGMPRVRAMQRAVGVDSSGRLPR